MDDIPTPVAIPASRRGRRSGNTDTRRHILDTAWTLFLSDGFSQVSLRAVARAANCDPALIHYYFDSKEQLFFDTISIAVNADQEMSRITEPGIPGLGRRVLTTLTAIYESPQGTKLITKLTEDPQTRTLLTQVITDRIEQVAHQLLPDSRSRRQRLIAQSEAIIAGFIYTRYLLRIEPATGLSRNQAIIWYGDLLQDTIQRCVTTRDRVPARNLVSMRNT